MKRTLTLTLALIIALMSFAACGGDSTDTGSTPEQSQPAEQSKAPVNLSLDAIKPDLVAMMAAEETFEVDADSVFNDTGINPSTYENGFWVIELSGLSAETIGFFKANSEADAQSIKTLLQGHLTSVTNQYKDYNADNYAMAQKAVIGSNGVYVYFVMSPNVDNIINTINSAFNG